MECGSAFREFPGGGRAACGVASRGCCVDGRVTEGGSTARRSMPDSVFRVDPDRVDDSFLTHASLLATHHTQTRGTIGTSRRLGSRCSPSRRRRARRAATLSWWTTSRSSGLRRGGVVAARISSSGGGRRRTTGRSREVPVGTGGVEGMGHRGGGETRGVGETREAGGDTGPGTSGRSGRCPSRSRCVRRGRCWGIRLRCRR